MNMSMSETTFIPLCVPHLRGKEWRYLKECLDTEWVSTVGSFVQRFEDDFATFIGAKYAVACASGSAALHIALMLAGVRPGDIVLVPTLTFIAPVNTIRYCGAFPLFLDADEHYNLDIDQTLRFFQGECDQNGADLIYRKTGQRIAGIIPVHVFGNAANLEPLVQICKTFGLPIIEDATESLGTRYLDNAGAHVGNKHTGTIGILGCFSFNGNKIITTGGGGMIVTDDQELAEKAKYLTTQAKDDDVRFIHNEIGYNYRLTNIQAAIGLAQLEVLENYKTRKLELYSTYQRALDGVAGLKMGHLPPYASNNGWMPPLQIDSKRYGEDPDQLMTRLAKAKIQCRPVWELNHRQQPYLDCQRLPTMRAEYLHAISLSIPCSVGLTPAQQDRVITELRRGR